MDLEQALVEIAEPHSRYQLEHFVIGQHDTPEMRFRQCVLELQTRFGIYKRAEIDRRRAEREIERLQQSDEPDADLDIELKQAGLEELRRSMIGCHREIETLLSLYAQIPHFTRDEIDQAQPEYWKKRLTRQTDLQLLSGNVGWAQLDAMRQAGLLDEAIAQRSATLNAGNGHQELEG